MTVYEQIGQDLKELRASKGTSQEDASLDIPISPSHLRSLERGKGNPTIKTLDRIAGYYNKFVMVIFMEEADQ